MSLLSENVIPGNHGKIFSTNAQKKADLKEIEDRVMEIEGIKDIIFNEEVFPVEFTILPGEEAILKSKMIFNNTIITCHVSL